MENETNRQASTCQTANRVGLNFTKVSCENIISMETAKNHENCKISHGIRKNKEGPKKTCHGDKGTICLQKMENETNRKVSASQTANRVGFNFT